MFLFVLRLSDPYRKMWEVDVIYIASSRDDTGPGASGHVQDLQGHHQDDQEQLLEHSVGFKWGL